MREERGQEPHRSDDGREPAAGSSVAVYAGLGLQFALSILVFLYLGQWLDRRFGTEPWLLLISVFVGAGGSFYSIYRKLMADLRRQEERRSR